MQTFTKRLNRKIVAIQYAIGQAVLRLFVLVLAAMAVTALGWLTGTDATYTEAPSVQVPTQQVPVGTPAQGPAVERAPVGDEYADHHLFNEDAVLDTSQIDDLRDDPASRCIAERKVYTPDGSCLPGVLVYRSDVPAEVRAMLVARGYDEVVDVNLYGDDEQRDALFVPEGAMVATDDGRWVFTDEGAVLQPYGPISAR